jgi:hypothetical protein
MTTGKAVITEGTVDSASPAIAAGQLNDLDD